MTNPAELEAAAGSPKYCRPTFWCPESQHINVWSLRGQLRLPVPKPSFCHTAQIWLESVVGKSNALKLPIFNQACVHQAGTPEPTLRQLMSKIMWQHPSCISKHDSYAWNAHHFTNVILRSCWVEDRFPL